MALRSINRLESLELVSVPLDVRGWSVRTAPDEERVGKVNDMLVDDAGWPRYLDVGLGVFRKHVLLPVGQAVTDPDDDVVWVQGLSSDQFRDIPEYEDDPAAVTDDYERRLVGGYEASLRRRRYHRAEYGGGWPPVRTTSATAPDVAAGAGSADPTVTGTERLRLRRLSELDDYELDQDIDPRGWVLVGAGGEKMGEVGDLVVEPQALRARYLEVKLDDDRLRGTYRGDARLLVPVGYARLDENARRVHVPALSAADLNALPLFADDFDEAYEDRIDRHFASRFEGDARYHHPRYDIDRFYAFREQVLLPHEIRREGRICDVRLRR